MTLLFVRHGESAGNAEGLIQGWLEFPLTPLGRAQAGATGRHLAGRGASALYSSPTRRARETADAIALATGLEVVELPDLREYCFGEAQGLRWEEAAARWGLAERDWGVGGVPGEEGLPAFRARVAHQFDVLMERYREETAICVVHGGVLGAIVAHLSALPPHEHAQIYSANCSIMAIDYERERAVITTLNDCCHLDDLQLPAGAAPAAARAED